MWINSAVGGNITGLEEQGKIVTHKPMPNFLQMVKWIEIYIGLPKGLVEYENGYHIIRVKFWKA